MICFYSVPRISLPLWCWSHLWLLQGILFIWSSDYPRRYNKGRCSTVVNWTQCVLRQWGLLCSQKQSGNFLRYEDQRVCKPQPVAWSEESRCNILSVEIRESHICTETYIQIWILIMEKISHWLEFIAGFLIQSVCSAILMQFNLEVLQSCILKFWI